MTKLMPGPIVTGYPAIQKRYAELADALKEGRSLAEPWRAFRDLVLATPQPYHLRWTMRWLDVARAGRAKQDVNIIEHGCGSCSVLLYFLAHGYTGIYGVDVGGYCEGWNRLLREEFGISELRFAVYSGDKLPFDDEHFDFVFSEEVLEHVAPDVFEAYYSEGSRVLKRGGIAYYQVPHRLVPYESHLRAWFIHWLPRRLAGRIYQWGKFDHHFFTHHLFLRWPTEHYRKLDRYFDRWKDVTTQRLTEHVDFDYYDGPVRLRRIISGLTTLPVLGPAFALLVSRFMMIQTVAWK